MRTPAGGFSAVTPTPSRPPDSGTRPDPEDHAARSPETAPQQGADTQPAAPPRPDSGARAIESLQALQAAIEQASSGLSAALEANTRLGSELSEASAALAAARSERDDLKARVQLVEQRLEDSLREAERNRDFLIAEQDSFLAGLLEEHERSLAEITRERDAALARTPVPALAPERDADAHDSGGSTARDPRAVEVATGAGAAHRTTPGLAPPTGVTPPVEPSIESVEKLLAERERTRDVLKRLQAQRDEAQQALAEIARERDELRRELAKLAPERFGGERTAWSPQAARRTMPAIPNIVARVTDPAPSEGLPFDELDDSVGDRVTAPPSDDMVAAIKASRPSPAAGTPAPEVDPSPALGVDGKPLLRRKPDPAQRSLGGYSVTSEPREPKSDRDRR